MTVPVTFVTRMVIVPASGSNRHFMRMLKTLFPAIWLSGHGHELQQQVCPFLELGSGGTGPRSKWGTARLWSSRRCSIDKHRPRAHSRNVRAIGVFTLVLATASPAWAGPRNSTIGGKQLEQDMVHSAGVGVPSIEYQWWNKGPRSLDWALTGELAHNDWPVALTAGRFVKIGFGVTGIFRWHLATKARRKVTNDVAILARPGMLVAGTRSDRLTVGIQAELGAPVSIDVGERVSVVTGGFVPFAYNINKDISNRGTIPLLVRLGVEVKANEKLAPWFYFDLGPGIGFGSRDVSTSFAWRVAAGLTFWSILGKNGDAGDPAYAGSGVYVEEPEPE